MENRIDINNECKEKDSEIIVTENHSWFKQWFDNDYYHILYKERDEEEAKLFLNKLHHYLQFKPEHTILDLACGRGRHANYLAALGLQVTGLDLSASSITYARQTATHPVTFGVHDMRQSFGSSEYSIILNLFTSFGYFDNEKENRQVLQHMTNALEPGGTVVIEYMNPHYIQQHLKPSEKKWIDDILFVIEKEIKENFVYKHIQFTHNDQLHCFTERVMLISLKQFEQYFQQCGLVLEQVFGDYHLNTFHKETSPRMILIAKKKNVI
jgi:cyclopropane fatty-acyl-phospholipid synthase-like methyltransferase